MAIVRNFFNIGPYGGIDNGVFLARRKSGYHQQLSKLQTPLVED
jgi:hypothetical protein